MRRTFMTHSSFCTKLPNPRRSPSERDENKQVRTEQSKSESKTIVHLKRLGAESKNKTSRIKKKQVPKPKTLHHYHSTLKPSHQQRPAGQARRRAR